MSENQVIISVRLPVTLRDLVQKFIEKDTHLNESDFYRDAIRDKILREAPELYRKLFFEVDKNERTRR